MSVRLRRLGIILAAATVLLTSVVGCKKKDDDKPEAKEESSEDSKESKSRTKDSEPTASATSTAETPAAEGAWKVGDKVAVQWQGSWYPATVLAVNGPSYQIHYDGWGSQWDEWVGPTRMRARTASDKAVAQPTGTPPAADYRVGQKVQVLWKGKYYAATIRSVQPTCYGIHYDGWGNEWDECVTKARIR